MSTLRAVIRRLAKHPGGFHCTAVAFTGWSRDQVGIQSRRMELKGELFGARQSRTNIRYFGTAAERDAFVHAAAARGGKAITRNVQAGGHAPWPADAPAVRTAKTVFTICPSATPRFREHTFGFVHGGLRAA